MAVTNYFWDMESDNVLMESDEAGVTTAVYTHEPGQYGKLISQYRGGETSFYHFDGQGSTRALTDPSQNVTDTYVYDAWGEEVASTGTTVNPFQWIGAVGYYRNPETATYYIRARAYAPETGRWLSRDPIGFAGNDRNLYEYVNSRPMIGVDPTGTVVGIVELIVALNSLATCFVLSGGIGVVFADAGDSWKHCAAACGMGRLCTAEAASVAGILKEIGPNVYDDYLNEFQKQLADTLSDVKANQACLTWETWIPIGGWIGHLCRESCWDCCDRVVGRHNNDF